MQQGFHNQNLEQLNLEQLDVFLGIIWDGQFGLRLRVWFWEREGAAHWVLDRDRFGWSVFKRLGHEHLTACHWCPSWIWLANYY